jgi:hypothetical protein
VKVSTCTSLSIAQVNNNGTSNGDISIWPNPAKNYLLLNGGNLKVSQIRMFDAVGKMVYASAWRNRIDVSMLRSGFYVVQFNTNEGVIVKRVEVIK